MRESLINGAPYFMQENNTHDGDGLPSGNGVGALITLGFDNMFRLMQDGVPNYEPEGKDSVAEIAKAEGKPPAEIVFDMLMENDGKGYVFLPSELCQPELRPYL